MKTKEYKLNRQITSEYSNFYQYGNFDFLTFSYPNLMTYCYPLLSLHCPQTTTWSVLHFRYCLSNLVVYLVANCQEVEA